MSCSKDNRAANRRGRFLIAGGRARRRPASVTMRAPQDAISDRLARAADGEILIIATEHALFVRFEDSGESWRGATVS